MTKTIDHDTCQFISAFQCDFRIYTAIHTKRFLGKCSQIKIFEGLFPFTISLNNLSITHFIDTIMFDDSSCCIISNQIVVFIIPCQCPRTDNIESAILFKFQLLLNCPLRIMEFDLFILINSRVNIIYVIIHRFILCLWPVYDEYISGKHFGICLTAKLLQFLYQFLGFLFCDKFRRLNCIHQELQLRQFKIPGTNIIARALAFLLLNIQSEFFKDFHLCINCSSVRTDPIFLIQNRA